MVRPAVIPEWAEDDVTLPTANTDNKIRPEATLRTLGYDSSDLPTAQNINYQFNLLSDWVRHFDSIFANLNDTGDWVTGTSYAVNDVWIHRTTGAAYVVLVAYTSGASEAADIALTSPQRVEVITDSSVAVVTEANITGTNLNLTKSDATTITVDLEPAFPDDVFLETAALSSSTLQLTMSNNDVVSVDLTALDDSITSGVLNGTDLVLTKPSGTVTVDLSSLSGGGGGSTNLSYTAAAAQGTINSDSGTNAVIPAATNTNAGLLLPSEKTAIGSASTPGRLLIDSFKTPSNTWNQAFDLAIAALPSRGGTIVFGASTYTFDATITITTGDSTDEIPRVSLEGVGSAATILVFTHTGDGITLTGGTGGTTGLQSYQTISGMRIRKDPSNTRTGGGLVGDNLAFFAASDLAINGWGTGVSFTDMLSSSFEDCYVRFNTHGWRFDGLDASEPNAIAIRSCVTGNCERTGFTILGGATVNFFGGSIESNGSDTSVDEASRYGILMTGAGLQGKVGLSMFGTYLENNRGRADVWLANTTHQVSHSFTGTSFNRISGSAFPTNNIRVESSNGLPTAVALTGCGFGFDNDYVPNAARPCINVIGNQVRVEDGGGNLFESAVDAFTFPSSGGGGATNLGYTAAATTGTVTSDTGTDATIPAATTSNAGLITGANQLKLNGIATGATVGATSAQANLLPKAFATIGSTGNTVRSSSVNLGSLRNNVGDYTVSYPPEASFPDALDLLTCAGNGLVINVFSVSSNSVRVNIRDSSGTLTDSPFNVVRF